MGKINTFQHTHPQTMKPSVEFRAHHRPKIMGPKKAIEVTDQQNMNHINI